MGDLGPIVSRLLQVVVRRDPLESCPTCGGNGEYVNEHDESYVCPCCEDSYEPPTPADLLTDPRVRALVEALDEARRAYPEGESDRLYNEATAALAPFVGGDDALET